jgi:hypothetical protein
LKGKFYHQCQCFYSGIQVRSFAVVDQCYDWFFIRLMPGWLW